MMDLLYLKSANQLVFLFLSLSLFVAMAHRPLIFTKGPLRLTQLVNLWYLSLSIHIFIPFSS
jgi:hypothetical protein